MDSSHSIGPKHGRETTEQKIENTEKENLEFRSFLGCSEIVQLSVPPMIRATTGQDKLYKDYSVNSKKRKFDVRSGGGQKDEATHSINKVGRVARPIMDFVASRSETLVLNPHKRARHIKRPT